MAQHIDPTHIPASYFLRLSTDLMLEVFDFVRSKIDQGSARLVSQEWNYLMKPRMWRTFTTEFRGTYMEDFETLVDGKNGCFQDIRELSVDGRRAGPDYYSKFRRFMDLMGENQLIKFESDKEGSISSRDLLCLLRRQQNLRFFSALLDLSDISIEDRASWTICQKETQQNEQDRATQEIEIACTRLFINSASLLTDLEICGLRPSKIDRVPLTALFSHSANPIHVPSTLRHLLIFDMDFCDRGNDLLGTINFSTIHSLKLYHCDRFGPLISALAASFCQSGTQLKALIVKIRFRAEWEEQKICAELDSLLSSFASLEALEIDFVFCSRINWKESLWYHQESLKSLLISSRFMHFKHDWFGPAVEKILKQCLHVEQFAYGPAESSIGNVEECELPCSLDSILHEMLNVVAAAPSIHVLRLLYAPGMTVEERLHTTGIDFDTGAHRQERDWAENTRLIVQSFATQVLRHLVDRGSNVRLLAISPVSRWKQDRSDSNGHYYPHYYYRCKTAEVDGKIIVDALPFRDCVAESPHATILRPF